jgi:peptide deformylase
MNPKLRLYPDPILKQMCEPIDLKNDKELMLMLAGALEAVLKKEGGLGLAAPQIGFSKRIFVYKQPDGSVMTVINPVIEEMGTLAFMNEGCLSIPGVFEKIKRGSWIKFSHMTLEGEPRTAILEGELGQCIQHETDHLNGVLFIDRLSNVMRSITLTKYFKKLKKAGL